MWTKDALWYELIYNRNIVLFLGINIHVVIIIEYLLIKAENNLLPLSERRSFYSRQNNSEAEINAFKLWHIFASAFKFPCSAHDIIVIEKCTQTMRFASGREYQMPSLCNFISHRRLCLSFFSLYGHPSWLVHCWDRLHCPSIRNVIFPVQERNSATGNLMLSCCEYFNLLRYPHAVRISVFQQFKGIIISMGSLLA